MRNGEPSPMEDAHAEQDAGTMWRRLDPEAARMADPLGQFAVSWLGLETPPLEDYLNVLEQARDEAPLQRYLADNKWMLARTLDGGHGRWVLDHPSLGGKYVPDFIIGHRWSGPTWEWILVELQSPTLKTSRNRSGRLYNKSGRTSEQLDEGIRQIQQWREWISTNIDLVRRPRNQHGLGFTGMSPEAPGLLLIGREDDLTQEHALMRKRTGDANNVRIHSYDWLARTWAHTATSYAAREAISR